MFEPNYDYANKIGVCYIYLRKNIPNQPQDPTMLYVEHPERFKMGDIVYLKNNTYDKQGNITGKVSKPFRIVGLDQSHFGNPDIVMALLKEVKER